MNENEMVKALDYMREDSAIRNKRGIAFIGASIIIWLGISIIQFMDFAIEQKNLYSWFVISLLLPVACMITKALNIKMQNKENPINKAGMLFTMNQILYISIVCWVCAAVPEKMIMILAMVFGGHLLPFGWLYHSKAYVVSSIIVTAGSLMIGCVFPAGVVAVWMLIYEIIFTLWLSLENRRWEKREN